MSQPLEQETFSRAAPLCPPATYVAIARLLYTCTGINLPAGNSSLVVSRLILSLIHI